MKGWSNYCLRDLCRSLTVNVDESRKICYRRNRWVLTLAGVLGKVSILMRRSRYGGLALLMASVRFVTMKKQTSLVHPEKSRRFIESRDLKMDYCNFKARRNINCERIHPALKYIFSSNLERLQRNVRSFCHFL